MKTNQTTPEQAERLIDFLADKTLIVRRNLIAREMHLGDGCMDNIEKGDTVWIKSIKGEEVVVGNEFNWTTSRKDWIEGDFEILGHDILLGDVLAKMWTDEDILDLQLFYLWRPLGLARSIQEIVRTGTEEVCKGCGANHFPCDCFDDEDEPTEIEDLETIEKFTPGVNALLQFLISIFLTNQE